MTNQLEEPITYFEINVRHSGQTKFSSGVKCPSNKTTHFLNKKKKKKKRKT